MKTPQPGDPHARIRSLQAPLIEPEPEPEPEAPIELQDRVRIRDELRSDGAKLESFGPKELLVPEPDPLLALDHVDLPPPDEDRIPKPKGVLQGWWKETWAAFHGDTGPREASRARKLVEVIGTFEADLRKMSNDDLRGQTERFRSHIVAGTKRERKALQRAEAKLEKAASPVERRKASVQIDKAWDSLAKTEQKILDKLLPEVFATVREASRRATGKRHFDVQVMASVLMHNGLIAEMYTGEGKTLAGAMTAYLNALPGHGFHVVTVNDYLAKRDATEMSDIFGFLGMSVGVLQSGGEQTMIDADTPGEHSETTRPEAYRADITYGTAAEFGFDYLRDNQVRDLRQQVQRRPYGVLLDEIDSLLIDEALIPLIIAQIGDEPELDKLRQARQLVTGLDWKEDVEWDLDEHWVQLTAKGIDKVEQQLGIENLFEASNSELQYHLFTALRAEYLMRPDEHYVVADGEVRTVGRSGHAYAGRRFVAGLHQAIEFKEGVEVRPENVTRASVTMRDYLGRYLKRAGMTGTAMSAREVFKQVYGMDVARVPLRNEPLIRVDHPDRRFKTREDKTQAFIDDLVEAQKNGRPILVGVEYTETAERLGELLQQRGLQHVHVLCAKSDAEEGEIIAQAGRSGSITVATSRGGRGVDIKLGGSPDVRAKELVVDKGMSWGDARREAAHLCALDRANVLQKGGLLVMGYEHLDSRRRDDQLRGRSGRQGDPGATVFYVAAEDALFDNMDGVEEIREGKAPFDKHKFATTTEHALDRSESKSHNILLQSQPFDGINRLHRERFYKIREDALALHDVRPMVREVVFDAVDDAFESYGADRYMLNEDEAKALYVTLRQILPAPEGDPPESWTERPLAEIRKDVEKLVTRLLDKRDEEVGEEMARVLERDILVSALDTGWSHYLDDITDLRSGVHLRAYGQKDPKLEYIGEASQVYESTLQGIRGETARRMLCEKPVVSRASSA